MKAVSYSRYGKPEEVIELIDLPAAVPGSGQVVVTLEAAPVHLADLENIQGHPWFRAPLPATPGYEGVGRVTAIGAGAEDFAVGDRVFLPIGLGTWTEEAVVSAASLWRAPENVAAEQLAMVPINLQTAYLMLHESSGLKPGDWVLQNAANSNVGYYVIRVARRLGYRTINIVRRTEAMAAATEAGGDVVLCDTENLAQHVAKITGEVALAIDAVGGTATARLASCLSPGGLLVSYGFAGSDRCEVSAHELILRQLTLRGFQTKVSLARMDRARIERMREAIRAMIDDGMVMAPIAAVYPFDRIQDALAHAAGTRGDRCGKVILIPHSTHQSTERS